MKYDKKHTADTISYKVKVLKKKVQLDKQPYRIYKKTTTKDN